MVKGCQHFAANRGYAYGFFLREGKVIVYILGGNIDKAIKLSNCYN